MHHALILDGACSTFANKFYTLSIRVRRLSMEERKLRRSFPASLSWSSRCVLKEVGGLKNIIIHYNNKLQQGILTKTLIDELIA